MKRPASFIVPAFVLGNYAAITTPEVSFFFMGVLLLVVCVGLYQLEGKKLLLGSLVLFALLGFFRMQQHIGYHQWEGLHLFYASGDHNITLEGQVTDVRRRTGSIARYQVLITNIKTDDMQAHVRMPVIITVTDYEGTGAVFEPGTQINMSDYQVTHDLRDHPQESYLKNWKSQGFHAVLETKAEKVSANGITSYLRWTAYRTRKQSEKIVDGLMPEPESDVLKSLLFGNQGYLSDSLRQLFTRTGTAHLIAVSGLHVGILAVFTQKIVERTGVGKPVSKGLTLLLIWYYAAMAGFPLSILRAGCMYTLYVGAYYAKRRYDAKSILCWSGMLFLWINPMSLWTISFQLSFAAVASLLWLYPLLLHLCPIKEKTVNMSMAKLALVTLTAQLGTWPIILWHFSTFSVVSVLANLMIVPFISLLMPLAIGMLLLGYFNGVMAAGVSMLVYGGTRYILWMASWFHEFSWAQINYHMENPIGIVVYYLVLTGIVWTGKECRRPDHCLWGKENVSDE